MSRDTLARVLPFVVYMAFLAVEDGMTRLFGSEFDTRWLYPVKVSVVALVLAYFWRRYDELHALATRPALRDGLLALLLGLLVFVVWINLNHGWTVVGAVGQGYNPLDTGRYALPLLAFRLAGASLVVPLIEELFWRSFLMRWLDQREFLSLAPVQVSARALLMSSLVFGFEHHQWLAGALAGLVYAGLYRYRGRLWTAIGAHAVTNLTLGIWVIATGSWQFW